MLRFERETLRHASDVRLMPQRQCFGRIVPARRGPTKSRGADREDGFNIRAARSLYLSFKFLGVFFRFIRQVFDAGIPFASRPKLRWAPIGGLRGQSLRRSSGRRFNASAESAKRIGTMRMTRKGNALQKAVRGLVLPDARNATQRKRLFRPSEEKLARSFLERRASSRRMGRPTAKGES
jgi:hypothetical protein